MKRTRRIQQTLDGLRHRLNLPYAAAISRFGPPVFNVYLQLANTWTSLLIHGIENLVDAPSLPIPPLVTQVWNTPTEHPTCTDSETSQNWQAIRTSAKKACASALARVFTLSQNGYGTQTEFISNATLRISNKQIGVTPRFLATRRAGCPN